MENPQCDALHFLFQVLVPTQPKLAMNSYQLTICPLRKESGDLQVAKKHFQDILGN